MKLMSQAIVTNFQKAGSLVSICSSNITAKLHERNINQTSNHSVTANGRVVYRAFSP